MACIILTGALADGTAITGKIVIPEVAHDSTEDDYVVWDEMDTIIRHDSLLHAM